MNDDISHNPYFNRWFSAITKRINYEKTEKKVTILILIDGFLQYGGFKPTKLAEESHNPYFNRWFSAITSKSNYKQKFHRSQSLF